MQIFCGFHKKKNRWSYEQVLKYHQDDNIYIYLIPFVCLLVHIQMAQINQSAEYLQILLRLIGVEGSQYNEGV